MDLFSIGDSVNGKRLVAAGREVSKTEVIAGSGRHRAQRVVIKGFPAKCYIDIPIQKL